EGEKTSAPHPQPLSPEGRGEKGTEGAAMKPAVLFVGHGSRDSEGTAEFLQIVDLFRAHDPGRIVECGFLEFARPVIGEGVARCVERGARTVAVLPGMLMA